VKADPETWTDEDTAPVPSRVFKAIPLKIDKVIRQRMSSSVKPIVKLSEREAIVFGRRSLEVAILAACSARERNTPRSQLEFEWDNLRDASQNAHRAIELLLRTLNPIGRTSRGHTKLISQSRLGRTTLSVNEINQRARRDAAVLVAARRITKLLSEDSQESRRRILELHPGTKDFEKRAFVYTLIEAWVFLTKGLPGKNPDSNNNPFLRFVDAAWVDWQGDGDEIATSFAHPLAIGLKAISESVANRLSTVGPHWR
jgi:hypothetical protein